ncbi:pyridoxamine 5'-phosphate oxidase family protein [uncultured Jatrophihabitans sp.]|uniref:pyridoxamine 5'-phosphate oxidase family protein n=1 Tax=uncultured Jatrophihabitans sp. TaxID=1610747 RepID=UPI0035CB45B4
MTDDSRRPSDPRAEIGSEEELRALLGEVAAPARDKERTRLTELDRDWLAASPFCLVATADEQGRCDVSPKGDPPGFTLVLDDTTIAIPERPGNRRADGFHNILRNPHVGLVYLIPGRGDTLRINGRARLVRDAPFFDRLVVKGHRPVLAVVVEIEEVFHHCAKAFLRSSLWQPDTWRPDAVAPRARIAQALERPSASLADLEQYYGSAYAERLYRP